MKIAVLISGEYREFEFAHKFWSFLKWQNVDCYFSTWNESRFVNKRFGAPIIEEHISEEQIRNLIKLKDLDIADINEYMKVGYNGYMIDRWHSVSSLMQKSGIIYDRVILLRPDIVLDYDEEFFRNFLFNTSNDDNDIYGLCGGQLNVPFPIDTIQKVSDVMFIGTQNSILKLLNISIKPFLKNVYEDPPSKYSPGPVVDIHKFLADYFLLNYNRFMNIPSRWTIARSTCRGAGNINFNETKLKCKEWFESKNKKFFSMADNVWEFVTPDFKFRSAEDVSSYNLWNKYNFKPWGNINTTSYWLCPDDPYTFDRTTKFWRETKKYITYGETDIWYRHNSYGFRIPENGLQEFEEAYNYPTVLVSGCSVTEGIGMPENHLWHTFLTDKFTEFTNLPVAKFNIGRGGISADAAIRYVYVSIEHKGARPDLVYILVPPLTRRELITTNSNGEGYIIDFLPGQPKSTNPSEIEKQEIIDHLERTMELRQCYHDYFQNLLFIKYYLNSKNIPWFFSCWAGDFGNIDYPKELEEHFIPVVMKNEIYVEEQYKKFKENIARDCAHQGPNSHFKMASEIYDKLLEKDEFLKLINKWNNNDR